ncbi:MAG: peptidase M48 [Ponticaulis sp.]|nr:peptidase M48 [Ponticaulis sp.]
MEKKVSSGLFARLNAILVLCVGLLSLPAHSQSQIRDAEIEQILRDFTDPVLEAARLNKEDVDVILLNDPSLNAFVARGQNIHLFTGLILASETPSQLIGVIAHETGHIEGGHNVRRLADMRNASGPAYISIGLGLLAIAAGAGDAGAALIASAPQFSYLNFATHTRAQEASADQAALRYLVATGRTPAGLLEFFENFRDVQLYGESERYRYFYTHPLASDRIEALRNGAEKSGLLDLEEDPEDVYKLEIMKAKLFGFIRPPMYVQREYPPSDQSIPAKYARAISAFQNDSLVQALELVDELIEIEPENPYFYELKGQILFENGRIDESVDPNRKALELAGGRQPLLLVGLARSLNARGEEEDLQEAEDLLNFAASLEPTNGYAWHELSQVLEKLDRRPEAQLAIAEQAYFYGDCRRALSFSMRAIQDLEYNSPKSIRATDITKICSTQVEREARR